MDVAPQILRANGCELWLLYPSA